MDNKIVSLHIFIRVTVFSIIVAIFFSLYSLWNDKGKIVFCDVGQGDGTYIRTIEHTDIIIDAGKDNQILNCLSKYMPLYDRTIEYAFLSHADFDHYGGFIQIFKRYKVNNFITDDYVKKDTFVEMLDLISDKTTVFPIFSNDLVQIDSNLIEIIWPPKEQIRHNYKTNQLSLVFRFSNPSVSVLFTGDIDIKSLQNIFLSCETCPTKKLQSSILKVPHHGSKNGLTSTLLSRTNPKLSVISVGKNSYGHPSPEILHLLNTFHKDYLRTDEVGDVVIEYDEKGWKLK